MNDFKTQAEIWKYLLESEDNKVENISRGYIIGFKNSSLYDYEEDTNSSDNFFSVNNWQKYKEPKKPKFLGKHIIMVMRHGVRTDYEAGGVTIDENGNVYSGAGK